MESKWLVKSKTFWGAIVATAPAWLQAFGISLADAQYQAIAEWGNQALALVGGLMVIVGRFKAKDSVTVLPK